MRADKANTEHSAVLDKGVREISKEIELEGFKRHHRLTNPLLDGNVGCSPDGGLWFRKGYLEVAFEAKHQGPSGNAIERWFKNYWIVQQTYPQAKFVTFCTGEGVKPGNGVHDIFNMVLTMEGKPAKSFNEVHNKGASFYLSEYGFSAPALNKIMTGILMNDPISSSIEYTMKG